MTLNSLFDDFCQKKKKMFFNSNSCKTNSIQLRMENFFDRIKTKEPNYIMIHKLYLWVK